MKNQTEGLKQRITAWLPPDMIENMEKLMVANNMKNHSELVAAAVDFYIGYRSTENSAAFLSDSLLDAIKGTLVNTENRMASNLFRLSVETSMMMHLLATTLEVSDDELRGLRGRCVAEVKRSKGKITIDDAVAFQHRENK